MGTPFEEVYQMFLSKMSSYQFVDFSDEELEDELEPYLEMAIGQFSLYCYKDIEETDISSGSFDEKLSVLEKDILSDYMIVGYSTMMINDLEGMEQVLNSREYRVYSEANYLDAKSKLRDKMSKTVNLKLSRYNYLSSGSGDMYDKLNHR